MHFRIRKGADIAFAGRPRQVILPRGEVHSAAVLGSDYPGFRPVFAVEERQQVVAGQVLFTDRRRPEIAITSPVSGSVRAIHRGPRRSLDAMVIERDGDRSLELAVKSNPSRDELIALLQMSGLWPALRTRPFGRVPDAGTAPAALFVTAMDTAPLAADPAIVIGQYGGWFQRGLEVLRHLTPANTYVCCRPDAHIPEVKGTEIVTFEGPHPAGLPSTHIHFVHPVGRGDVVWHIGYQDVIAVGHLIETGTIWPHRVISLAGSAVADPSLVLTVPGASLRELTAGHLRAEDLRLLSGSPLDGQAQQYLGRYDLQVTALVHPRQAVRRDGLVERIRSRVQQGLSALVPNDAFERVAPARILPLPFLRAISVGDLEAARKLGALELVEEDMSLLAHVDGSGVDYGQMLRATLDELEAAQ